MIRFLMITTLFCVGFCAGNAQAQPDCDDWNSIGFFESATAADVKRRLDAGGGGQCEHRGWRDTAALGGA